MADVLRRIAGVRLAIAVQVFTTLLILAVGYLVIERNLRELALSTRPITPFQVKMALLNIRTEVLIVAFVAFLSGLALTLTIRKEVKKISEQLKRLSQGLVDTSPSRDLSDEFVPISNAIRELADSVARLIQQSATDGVILIGPDLLVEEVNPAGELLLGYKLEEIRGKPLKLLFPKVKDNERLYAWIEGGAEWPSQRDHPTVGVIVNKEGEWMTVRLALFQIKAGRRPLKGIVVGVFDQEEWRRIRGEFEKAERLSNLGMVVKGLAHEIKNPLGAIKGLTQMLMEDFTKDNPKRRYLETIVEESERLDDIMKRLLDLSLPLPWRKERVDLGKALDDVLTLMQGEAASRGVSLKRRDLLQQVIIEGDPERIKQAIINVLKNAIEATSQGQAVSCGIEQEANLWALVVENIFFGHGGSFVEKGEESWRGGGGIGLLITQQIMHNHGGYVDVRGPSGGKIQVRLVFPRKGAAGAQEVRPL